MITKFLKIVFLSISMASVIVNLFYPETNCEPGLGCDPSFGDSLRYSARFSLTLYFTSILIFYEVFNFVIGLFTESNECIICHKKVKDPMWIQTPVSRMHKRCWEKELVNTEKKLPKTAILDKVMNDGQFYL